MFRYIRTFIQACTHSCVNSLMSRPVTGHDFVVRVRATGNEYCGMDGLSFKAGKSLT